MSAHHLDESRYSCVCGSAWNFYEKGCSYLYPAEATMPESIDEEAYSSDFFECRKGHAFCGRH